MVSNELIGITSFWRGNVASICRYFPNQALNFSFKDSLREVFLPSSTSAPSSNESIVPYMKFIIGNLLAGGFAGAGALTCTYPLDLARTRLAADVGMLTIHMNISIYIYHTYLIY